MSNQIALQKALLEQFGNPLAKGYPESKVFDEWQKDGKFEGATPPRWIINHLEVLAELNKKTPVAAHFGPNGNFGTKVGTKDWRRGGKQVIKATDPGATFPGNIVNKKELGFGSPYNAIVVDCDLKDTKYESLEDYWNNSISRKCKSSKPSFVVPGPGGFHIYYIFKKEDRDIISKSYSALDMENLQRYFFTQFEGGDVGSRACVSAFIRLPYSYHWKSGKPYQIHACRYVDDMKFKDLKKNIISDPGEFATLPRLSAGQVATFYQIMTDDFNFQKKEEKQYIKQYGDEKYREIEDIPMKNILEKLATYETKKVWTWTDERIGKIINVVGHLEIAGGSFVFIRGNDGELYPTSGYKLETENDYLNNFSGSHANRPRGRGLKFLTYYFDKKLYQVEDFLFRAFGLTIQKVKLSDGEEELSSYKSDLSTFTLRFTNKRVVLSEIVSLASGKQITRDTNLFESPMTVTARTITKMDREYGTLPEPIRLFIIKNWKGEEVSIYPDSNASGFNKKNMHLLGHFYGTDSQLGKFFHALEHMEGLSDRELKRLAGFYKDGVYFLGNKVVSSNKSNDVEQFFLSGAMSDKTQITLKELTSKIAEVWDKDVACIAPLLAVMLAGMNIREEQAPTINLNPAIFLSGKTGTGKSTLADVIRSIIGFNDVSGKKSERVSRLRSRGAGNLTRKAFHEDATLQEPLTLEEMTDSAVKKDTVEIIRNVINRESGARGTIGRTVNYAFKAPLMCVGESLTKGESINNRMCILALREINKLIHKDANGIVNTSKLNDLLNYTAWKDVYETLYKVYSTDGRIEKAVSEAQDILYKAGVESRNNDKRARVLASLSFFDIGYSQAEVVESILHWMKVSGEKSDAFHTSSNPAQDLKGLIMPEVINRKCFGTKYEYNSGGERLGSIYEMTFVSDYLNINKARWGILIEEIKTLTGSDCIKIFMASNTIIFRVDKSIPESGIITTGLEALFKLLNKGYVEQITTSMNEHRNSY